MRRFLITVAVVFAGLCYVSGSKSNEYSDDTIVQVNKFIDKQLSERIELLGLDLNFLTPLPIVPE